MQRLTVFARKDATDSVRERQLHLAVVLFGLVGLGVGYLVGSSFGVGGQVLPVALLGLLLFLAPLTAIVLSYNVLVGKRASGELTVLLGLPFSRGEVVFGTVLGRFAIMTVLVSSTVVVGGVVTTVLGDPPSIDLLFGTALAGLAITLAFVALSVGISANTRNTTRASGLAFGAFLLFVFRLWDVLPVLVNTLLDQLSAPTIPSWGIDLYLQLTPHAAIRNLVEPVFPALSPAFGASVSVPPGGPVLGLTVLAAWVAGPLLLGYYRFGTADI